MRGIRQSKGVAKLLIESCCGHSNASFMRTSSFVEGLAEVSSSGRAWPILSQTSGLSLRHFSSCQSRQAASLAREAARSHALESGMRSGRGFVWMQVTDLMPQLLSNDFVAVMIIGTSFLQSCHSKILPN